MDAQITIGVISATCATIAASCITGFFVLRTKQLDIKVVTRAQDHLEEKDDDAKQKEITENYRRAWKDEEARRIADLADKDLIIQAVKAERDDALKRLKDIHESRTQTVVATTPFSVDIEPNMQKTGT